MRSASCFEAAERTERLGLVVDALLQARCQCGVVQVGDGGNRAGGGHGKRQGWIREGSTPGAKCASMQSARPSNTASSVRRRGAEQRLQHGRVFEQAVQVEPEHVAGAVLPRQAGHHFARHVARRGHGRVLRGLAVVDFVAAHRDARQRRPRRRAARRSAPAVRAPSCRARTRVTSGSRPRPGPLPSMPCGSISASPSICRPPQMPSTAPPRAACAAMARSRPCARSQARSPLVCLEPGSTIQSAPASVGRAARPAQAHAGHVLRAAGIRRGC